MSLQGLYSQFFGGGGCGEAGGEGGGGGMGRVVAGAAGDETRVGNETHGGGVGGWVNVLALGYLRG